MTKKFSGFAGDLSAYQRHVLKANRDAVEAIARDVKRFTMIRLGSPTGRPVRLRNVGKKGARIGVSYDVKQYETNVTAVARAFGPFQLVENEIKPHPIPRVMGSRYARLESGKRSYKRELTGKTTRDQGKRYLHLPEDRGDPSSNIRLGPLMHPGVSNPKRPFHVGVTLANKGARANVETRLNQAMMRSF